MPSPVVDNSIGNATRAGACEISVILPVYNEQECIARTVEELVATLDTLGRPYEVLAIDDGSTDHTSAILTGLQLRFAGVRVFTLTPNSGQSAAFGVGFRHARGSVSVLMDADGQNDPGDIARLLTEMPHCDACCGIRVQRQDSFSKRIGSRLANRIRRAILDDGTIDTGCSLKALRTDFLGSLPMDLCGMHRFIPALLLMRGARLRQIPVNHRPRSAGKSKYTNFGRLLMTIQDLRAVRWMQQRHRHFRSVERPDPSPVARTGIPWPAADDPTRTSRSAPPFSDVPSHPQNHV